MSECTFFGHRECYSLDEQALTDAIEDLIRKGVDTFYVGNQVQFDSAVYACLKQLRNKHPHIRVCVVLAYLPTEKNEYDDLTDSMYPEIEGHPKFAIERRNRWMIDHSDFLLCYVSREKYEELKRFNIHGGDIIVSCRGTIGETYIVPDDAPLGIMHPSIMKIRLKPGVYNKQYFNLLLRNYLKQHEDEANGSGIKMAISAKELGATLFPVPNMAEQNQIASAFNQVEELISLRKEQISKLDQLVKSRFIELFGDKDLPQITIGELVASKVSSVKKVFSPTDTIRYVDISSIDNKRNIMTGYTEYFLNEAPSRAQQHIKKGDIVVSTVRPNLKNVAITSCDYDNLVASSGFCVLRAEKCLPSYLMAVVCSDDFTDAMTKVVTGANYPAIKDSDVRNYVIPNPPVELQEQFSAFVEQIDKSKLAIQQSLDKLELLKKSLMQEYFG